jgi:hypothetical protein
MVPSRQASIAALQRFKLSKDHLDGPLQAALSWTNDSILAVN